MNVNKQYLALYEALSSGAEKKSIMHLIDKYIVSQQQADISPLCLSIKFDRDDISIPLIENKLFNDTMCFTTAIDVGNIKILMLLILNGYKPDEFMKDRIEEDLSKLNSPNLHEIFTMFYFVIMIISQRYRVEMLNQFESTDKEGQTKDYDDVIKCYESYLSHSTGPAISIDNIIRSKPGALSNKDIVILETILETAPAFAWFYKKSDLDSDWSNTMSEIQKEYFGYDYEWAKVYQNDIEEISKVYQDISRCIADANTKKYGGSCLSIIAENNSRYDRKQIRLKAIRWMLGVENTPFSESIH